MPSDTDSNIRKILDFWFGDNDGETVPERQTDMWFRNGRDYNADIREKFADLIDYAAAGAFDAWGQSGTGRLALIVLLDQFPRHVHRNHARACPRRQGTRALPRRLGASAGKRAQSFAARYFLPAARTRQKSCVARTRCCAISSVGECGDHRQPRNIRELPALRLDAPRYHRAI